MSTRFSRGMTAMPDSRGTSELSSNLPPFHNGYLALLASGLHRLWGLTGLEPNGLLDGSDLSRRVEVQPSFICCSEGVLEFDAVAIGAGFETSQPMLAGIGRAKLFGAPDRI